MSKKPAKSRPATPRQLVLTVYFPDPHGAASTKSEKKAYGKNVAVAFRPEEQDKLFVYGKSLSSDEIRTLVGAANYSELRRVAGDEPISSYIRRKLEEAQQSSGGIDRLREAAAKERGPMEDFSPSIEDSPHLIRHLLETYAPKARQVLDPFAGTGAVVVTAGQMGTDSWWCELNPFYQYVTNLKVDLMKRAVATSLVERIKDKLESLKWTIAETAPALQHRAEFRKRFAGRESVLALESELLKTRTWVDEVHETDPLLARILGVAVATAAARTARGAQTKKASIEPRLEETLNAWIHFLETAPDTFTVPRFLTENAFDLTELKPLRIDTVCTVPPLLNTTEVASDEIAAWFLRLPPIPGGAANQLSEIDLFPEIAQPKRAMWLRKVLEHSTDARATWLAGLTDDTVAKIDQVSEMGDLLRELFKQSPPHAVHAADYFVMIGKTTDALQSQLDENATVILVLTDDWLGKVEVRVTMLVQRLMQLHGFSLVEEIVQKTSRSTRGGREIRECVVVMRRGKV